MSRDLTPKAGLTGAAYHDSVYCNAYLYTWCGMRTNIVIDDQLMDEALKASGCETKKEAVEQGLKLLVQRSKQQQIRDLRGKIKWEGDLDEMRSTR